MMVHLVTDRRRLTGLQSPGDVRRCLVRQARYAIEAGIDVVQIREPGLEARDLLDLVEDIVSASRGTRTRVVVSDRIDVALAAGADGVHLPRNAVRPAWVRRVVPAGFLIGSSVHSVSEAREAHGADYLVAGTVWASASKPSSHPLIGVAGLEAIVHAVDVPVLAIGGATVSRAGEVAAAGGAGIAAIGLFVGAAGLEDCRAVPLSAMVDALRHRFDTPRSGS
jgi:thiamine-phosphate diphosphorylase